MKPLKPTGRTRSGKKVTLLKIRREFLDFPVLGQIEGHDGWEAWRSNGLWSYDENQVHPNDLTEL